MREITNIVGSILIRIDNLEVSVKHIEVEQQKLNEQQTQIIDSQIKEKVDERINQIQTMIDKTFDEKEQLNQIQNNNTESQLLCLNEKLNIVREKISNVTDSQQIYDSFIKQFEQQQLSQFNKIQEMIQETKINILMETEKNILKKTQQMKDDLEKAIKEINDKFNELVEDDQSSIISQSQAESNLENDISFSFDEQPPEVLNENILEQQVMYVTRTGNKFHRLGCKWLQHSAIPITLFQATLFGYGECRVCRIHGH